ncbi:MAG: hypothetical protein AB2A00_38740 [Myxococcota bacterium]
MRTLSAAILVFLAACTNSTQEGESASKQPSTNVSLQPPAAGRGFQYTTGEFEVAPGLDLQQCFFFQVPGNAGEEIFVNRIEVAQNEGTHHMNIFRVRTITPGPNGLGPEGGLVQRSENGLGACFDDSNWADWPLVINSQTGGYIEWNLPGGVAHKFTGGEWIMLQSHYVNAATQETPGKGNVFVNFHFVPRTEVQHEVGTLFASKQSIRICQHDQRSVYHGTCQIPSDQPVHIIGANGHFHSRGTRFEMYAWDGVSPSPPADSERFYVSEDWKDPPMLRSPELDHVVPAGGGIWYTCEYQWREPTDGITCDKLNEEDTKELGTPPEAYDCCYTFGGPVDWAEHCNVFAYYYPASNYVHCY